jgi:hypothetical protein
MDVASIAVDSRTRPPQRPPGPFAPSKRVQYYALSGTLQAAKAPPPTPATLAAGLGEDDDWEAPRQPEPAAEEALQQPEQAPPSLRRAHRRKVSVVLNPKIENSAMALLPTCCGQGC